MIKLSLPKSLRHSSLYLLVGLVFLMLLGEVGYYYWLKSKQSLVPQELSEEQKRVNEKGQEGKKLYEQLKDDIKAQEKIQNRTQSLLENCLRVPSTDPKIGIFQLDKKEENIYDYYYEGRVVKVEEKNYQSCPYIYLVLKLQDEFTLAIPASLLAQTDLGKVSANVYKQHLNERIKIKIRYQEEPAGSGEFKILEWQPLVFLIE